MRVLHLNSLLTGGGTDDQCAKIARGLVQLRHAVWVAGPAGREVSQVIRDLDIPFHATPPEGPLKLRLIFDAARFIRRKKIQFIHGHHGRDLWPTIMAARLSGKNPRIVLTRHMAKSPSSWFSRRFLLGQCDALIAVSHFVAKVMRDGVDEPGSPELERRHRPPLLGDHSKIHVLYGGIDTERFRPFDAQPQRQAWGLEPHHYAFAVVGGYSLPRGKGQREFLKAAAMIHKEAPDARFLIVGRGSMADVLQSDIAQLGLRGKAWLTPYCHDMPTAMNAIDCLVHPQIGTEALGLVVCEAHACGKPVIASGLDGIPEAFAVGNFGQMTPPEDVSALANAMRHWANEARATEPARAELHARVSASFSLGAAAGRVAALYLQLGGKPA